MAWAPNTAPSAPPNRPRRAGRPSPYRSSTTWAHPFHHLVYGCPATASLSDSLQRTPRGFGYRLPPDIRLDIQGVAQDPRVNDNRFEL